MRFNIHTYMTILLILISTNTSPASKANTKPERDSMEDVQSRLSEQEFKDLCDKLSDGQKKFGPLAFTLAIRPCLLSQLPPRKDVHPSKAAWECYAQMKEFVATKDGWGSSVISGRTMPWKKYLERDSRIQIKNVIKKEDGSFTAQLSETRDINIFPSDLQPIFSHNLIVDKDGAYVELKKNESGCYGNRTCQIPLTPYVDVHTAIENQFKLETPKREEMKKYYAAKRLIRKIENVEADYLDLAVGLASKLHKTSELPRIFN